MQGLQNISCLSNGRDFTTDSMHYQHFTAEDFVADAFFRKWVFNPDQDTQVFWSQWLKEHPDKRAEVEQAKQILRTVRFNYYQASQQDFQEVWVEIEIKRKRSSDAVSAHQQVKSRSMHRLWLKVAASVSILAMLLYLLTYPWHYETYVTAYGERKTIILPDETELVMNANSSLKFDKQWKEHQRRQVWLEGEAFFHVNKVKSADDKNLPFLVHTGELAVEVLGTEFNVHARRGETKVVLNSGKVKLNLEKQQEDEIYMSPGEMVEVSENNPSIIRKQVKPEEHTSWRNNWLVFEAATLAEVKEILEDQYGYKVIIEKENLVERKFKGRFPLDKIDLMLQAIEASLDIEVKRDHKKVYIQNR